MAGDANTTPKKKEPTAQEAMFFFAIVKHTRNKADIDWSAVATEQGFKNAEVAKVRFGQVKRKLGISTDIPTPGGSVCGSASRTTPTKRAAAGAAAATPTKITKTAGGRAGSRGMRKTPKKEELEDQAGCTEHDDDDDDGDDDDDLTVAGTKKEIKDDDQNNGMTYLNDDPF